MGSLQASRAVGDKQHRFGVDDDLQPTRSRHRHLWTGPGKLFTPERTPSVSCSFAPAHTEVDYDNGLAGLHAAFYNNAALAGSPKVFSLGSPRDGRRGGQRLGAAAPIAGVTETNDWSLRLTGLITFPGPGTYKLETYANDGTQVWVDNILRVDDWQGSGLHWSGNAQTFTIQPGENPTKPIRIHYRDDTGDARLQLVWSYGDGAVQRVTVPGSALSPDYGLPNRTTVEDSAPAGRQLRTRPTVSCRSGTTTRGLEQSPRRQSTRMGSRLEVSSTYEAPGSGWLRRLSRTMPSGAPATTTSTYWVTTAPRPKRSVACPSARSSSASSSRPPPLLLRGKRHSDRIRLRPLRRTVGTKRSGDDDWSCVTYDERGRVSKSEFASYNGTPDRTVTYDYSADDDPRSTSVTDSLLASQTETDGVVISTVDLLGRSVSSTDLGHHDRPGLRVANRARRVRYDDGFEQPVAHATLRVRPRRQGHRADQACRSCRRDQGRRPRLR